MDESKESADVWTTEEPSGCRNCGGECAGNYCSTGCADECEYWDAADRAHDAAADRGEA